jgi:ribosomal 50S subunit-recycling heat shock protein
MRKTVVSMLAVTVILMFSAGGFAAEKSAKMKAADEPPAWKTSTMAEESATVQAIDQKTRMVTLKGAKGNEVTFKAGDEVRNLAQVHVGDVVNFSYYESLEVRVLKKGEKGPMAGEVATMARAKPGEKPAGAAGSQTTVVAKITAIDMKAKTATLQGEDGTSVTVTPRYPERLKQVKVGDRIAITYTEAVVVNVEKVGKK